MGTEPLSDLPTHSTRISIRSKDPRDIPVGIRYYSHVCSQCDDITLDDLGPEGHFQRHVPNRCVDCCREKYTWLTRKKLHKEIIPTGPCSMQVYTLGPAQYTPWRKLATTPAYSADTLPIYWELRKTLKDAFRKFIRSKWWRNRVDGCFYTIEIKDTLEWKTEGTDSSPVSYHRYKLHAHVHAITQHEGFHDFKAAAASRGLGDYTYSPRIKGRDLTRPINYVLKYSLKDYGNPSAQGRYYERTGVFRKRKASGHGPALQVILPKSDDRRVVKTATQPD